MKLLIITIGKHTLSTQKKKIIKGIKPEKKKTIHLKARKQKNMKRARLRHKRAAHSKARMKDKLFTIITKKE